MNRVLALNKKLSKYPFGQFIFSRILARMAPYFTTIKPFVEEIKPNYIKVSMKKRRAVYNHIKTVHAIASCNLCEFAAGICMEASIPNHRRWIPIGMQVAYQHKATTDLSAICDLSAVNWNECSEVDCQISVLDKAGLEVVKATIKMKVSDKKKV